MKMEKRFCVIGPEAGMGKTWARTWFVDADEAAQHGGRLVGKSQSGELYVVQIVRVIRPKADYEVEVVE